MKGKLLSFPFKSFSESRLFNGLRPIQIKKFPPLSPVVRDGLESISATFAFSSLEVCRLPIVYHEILLFVKSKAKPLVCPVIV
jgi:hypothetical protein